jgi:hypothetical protein
MQVLIEKVFDGSAMLPVLMNSVLIRSSSLAPHPVENSRTSNVRRPTQTAPLAMAELITLSIAKRHSGRRGHLLDPRSTARQMPIERARRTADLLRHLDRRHIAGRQHRLGSTDFGIIQRYRHHIGPVSMASASDRRADPRPAPACGFGLFRPTRV